MSAALVLRELRDERRWGVAVEERVNTVGVRTAALDYGLFSVTSRWVKLPALPLALD